MRNRLSQILLAVLGLPLIISAVLHAIPVRAVTSQVNAPQDDQPIHNQAGSPETILGELPVYFIANQGQSDEQVSFYVQGSAQTVFFTPQGVTFTFAAPVERGEETNLTQDFRVRYEQAPSEPTRQRWAVRLDFVGANPNVQPVGELPTQAVVSYFKGSPDQWQAGVPTYAQIRYPELWPGIDLVYSGQVNELKYEFVVQPGADPAQIQLAYHGADDVRQMGDGRLEVSTPVGSFYDAAPVAYQLRDGQRLPVEIAYALDPSSGSREDTTHRYGFRLDEYDPSLPLILDPALLIYAGFIGGSDEDYGESIAVDLDGNTYIAGAVRSYESAFQVADGPDHTYDIVSEDAFVAKISADGKALLYASYIGGADWDFGESIAVDADGNAYITGETGSTENSFPVLGGPDLTHNGISDAFVAKLSADGIDLLYAGYIGGASFDYGFGIAVNQDGVAYISGRTESDESSFPVTMGPDLTYNGGYYDAFVAKVNSDGTALEYAGYIGGADADEAIDIAVDSQGNIYITGATRSDESSFPVKVGPDLTHNDGWYSSEDGFVAKVNPAGTGLVYAGYIGGSGADRGNAIAVDAADHAYITGSTESSDFPSIAGPYLTKSGGSDAFVLNVDPSGARLIFSGFIGGYDADIGNDIALGPDGAIYITGTTQSYQTTFPVLDGPDLLYNGGSDAFITVIKPPAGSAWLVFSGYIGGSEYEGGYGIAVDQAGNAYLTGSTGSTEDSFPVKDGPDLTYNGGADVFVVKVGAWQGEVLDLSVSRVELFQGITMSPSYIVHIANKPTMLRVFVNLEGRPFVNGVVARLTLFMDGMAQDSIELGPVTIYADTNENSLQHTLNFDLPANWLLPGTSYVLQLDPWQAVPETNENNNHYPASGYKSFNFVNAPALEVVVVPVTYARPGAPVTYPSLDDLSYLTWMPKTTFPVAQINYTIRSIPHIFTGDLRESGGWSQLLNDIETIHSQEDPGQKKYYYGLINSIEADDCSHGCTVGIAWLNDPTSLYKTATGISNYPRDQDFVSSIFTHEMAHLFGRRHVYAECGIMSYVDPDYPYEDGKIGQWGYNHDTKQLIDPLTRSDYMSYCRPTWTSDYTYYGIYQAFRWVEGWQVDQPYRTYLPSLLTAQGTSRTAKSVINQSLTLSGYLAADGSLQISPLFLKPGPPDKVSRTGEYSLALLDASGRQLHSQPFELTAVAIEQVDSGEMTAGFHLSLPFVEGVAGIQISRDGQLVFERYVTGAAMQLSDLERADRVEDGVRLSWSAGESTQELAYRVLFSADGGATWQMLAANTKQSNLSVPVSLLQGAANPRLMVQVSDGVQISGQVYDLKMP